MVDTTVRSCVTCHAPLFKKPGPGRWPRYCSDECNPHALSDADRAARHAAINAGCVGCGASIVQGARSRNLKKWCSETCRQREWAVRNPELVSAQIERRADRLKSATIERNSGQRCTVCGDEFGSRWPRKYCSDPCKFRAAHVARYAIRKGARREPYALADVLSASRCGICTGGIDQSLSYPHPMSVSLDHIVPLSMGGDDVRENVQAAHLRCNQSKGGRFT